MVNVDLSDIFDTYYESHQDFSAELSLRREDGKWKNDDVSFWKDESLGWRFSAKDGHYNYWTISAHCGDGGLRLFNDPLRGNHYPRLYSIRLRLLYRQAAAL